MQCGRGPYLGLNTVEKGGYWTPYIGRCVFQPILEKYNPYQDIPQLGRVQEYFLGPQTPKESWCLSSKNAPNNEPPESQSTTDQYLDNISKLLSSLISTREVTPPVTTPKVIKPKIPSPTVTPAATNNDSNYEPSDTPDTDSIQLQDETPDEEETPTETEDEQLQPFSTVGLNAIPRLNFEARFNYLRQYPANAGPPNWSVLRRLRMLFLDMDLRDVVGGDPNDLDYASLIEFISAEFLNE